MSPAPSYPYAGFLARLEEAAAERSPDAPGTWPSLLDNVLATPPSPRANVIASLTALLVAHKATLRAAFDTTLAADELRRYQKFAKPGKPSAHIVQLRQRQAAARQATSNSRQALIKAAMAFVRDAGIDVPERTPLDAFIIGWIETVVPADKA